jgi:hypothetical protein
MKTNYRQSLCCNFCEYCIFDGDNRFCNEDDSYKDALITDSEQILWEWAVLHACKKMNICDDFEQR